MNSPHPQPRVQPRTAPVHSVAARPRRRRRNDCRFAAGGAVSVPTAPFRAMQQRSRRHCLRREGPSRLPASTTPPGRLLYASRSHAAVEAVVTALMLAGSGHPANAPIADPEERSAARRVLVCGEEHVARAGRAGTSIHVRAGVVAGRGVGAYVRKQSPAMAPSASPWWLVGSASGDAIDRARDRSRGQGVAGAAARSVLPRDTNGAARAARDRCFWAGAQRRVGAAQPRIGTSQAWNLPSQACVAPQCRRALRRVACGGGDQKSGPAFAPRLLSHARVDRPARVICPPPWPVVARARVTPLIVDQPNSIPVPEGA